MHSTLRFERSSGRNRGSFDPPKVRHFLWRLAHNSLPLKMSIKSQGIVCALMEMGALFSEVQTSQGVLASFGERTNPSGSAASPVDEGICEERVANRTSSGLQSEHLAVEVLGVGRTKKKLSM
jgi:hypothetical protein